MTRLALVVLLVLIPGLTAHAQEPKPATTELEGIWREPLRPGEKAEDRMVVTFSGDEITVVLNGAIYRGTIRSDPESDRTFVRFSLILVDEKVKFRTQSHSGLCLKEAGQLYLQVFPYAPGGNVHLHLAPVTFKLQQVKK